MLQIEESDLKELCNHIWWEAQWHERMYPYCIGSHNTWFPIAYKKRIEEARKAGVLIGLENRDDREVV
jgi:hypothetical protein